MSTTTGRKAAHEIEDVFLQRHSSRAFSGEPLERETLLSLLEAAHWAPSSSNSQPWRFFYAFKGTAQFERLAATLAPSNHLWAQHASALVMLLSMTESRSPQSGQLHPLQLHMFDSGTASGFFALQANLKGLNTHVMAGFDRERARAEFQIPAVLAPLVIIAVGKKGNVDNLPADLQARETPSGRLPLSVLAFEGELSNFSA